VSDERPPGPDTIPKVFPPTLAPDDDVATLARARAEADARYNRALSAVDAAIIALREAPHPPPAPDETQVTPLNERWRILPDAPPVAGGWLQRKMAGLAWRVVAPILERQQAFNSALVDHVNRGVPVDRATRQSIDAALRFTGDALGEIRAFQSTLIQYFQQLTAYVDTKDFEFAGHIRDRYIALNGAVAGLTDEILKRWESMVARERRFDAKATAIGAAQAETSREFRDAIAVLHQATIALKRELERGPAFAATSPTFAPTSQTATVGTPLAPVSSATHGRFGAWKYVGFEDRFRGSRDEIRTRLEAYLPIFSGASDVLDVGCGRGEFLNLLREQGVSARGLDLNHEMVEVCRAQGLDAAEGDALGYLRSLPDGSLGGLFAAQVAEHLEPDYLLELLEEAFTKLRPGSAIVLETINPACWFAFFSSYIRDITHVRPLHPDTLSYLLTAHGFQEVTVRYSAPYPERDKLVRVPGEGLVEDALNANADKLNALLFTYMDYAAVGRRR
jgi:O-antigen chain-terminating methyltransferase